MKIGVHVHMDGWASERKGGEAVGGKGNEDDAG